MLTEDEAKTKWCPMARVHHGTGGNRWPMDTDASGIAAYAKCIGSACMAFRWSRAKETKAYLDAVQARMKETGENFNVATNKVWAEIGSTFEKTEGYCGAFGSPTP